MAFERKRLSFAGSLSFLIICALLLIARLIYLYVADAQQFPVNTIKISATYEHIGRQTLEQTISNYSQDSFFTFKSNELQKKLDALPWVKTAKIEKSWPDTIKIRIVEKVPFAIWNDQLITDRGEFLGNEKNSNSSSLPRLIGPENQQTEVLQMYQKLSKLLVVHDLHAKRLRLRANQAWDLTLTNGLKLKLGKRDLELRLRRFCQAYPAVFADKHEQLSSVDLRYARGMAVQWNQQTGR